MLIRSRKHFVAGIVMVGSFFAVCIYLLFPMLHDNYGNRLTGLQFADSVFNWLSAHGAEETSVIQRYGVSFKKIRGFIAALIRVCNTAMEHGYGLVGIGD